MSIFKSADIKDYYGFEPLILGDRLIKIGACIKNVPLCHT